MIRGEALIFLLSLVVLVIGQTRDDYPCTCRDNARDTFFAKAQERWPFPSVDQIDITRTPPDLTEITAEFAEFLSIEQFATAFLGTSTTEWERRVNAATVQADDHTEMIQNITDIKAAYDKEKQITIDRWAVYRAQTERWENIQDPISAIDYLLSYDQILSRTRWCLRIENYLTVWGEAYPALANIFTVRKNILQKLKDLSQGLDEAVANCVPSVTTPVCTREVLAITYLSSNPIVSELTTDIAVFNTHVNDYQSTILTQVNDSSGLFVRITDRDNADTMDRTLLYDNYARIQNVVSPTFDQIKIFLSQLLLNEGRLTRILERIKNLFLSSGDYQLTDSQFTCALDSPNIDHEIKCQYTGTISGSGDLSEAVDRLVSSARVVYLANTGALVIDCTKTYDIQTNVYTITLTWSRRKLYLLRDIFLLSPILSATADIREIVIKARNEFKSLNDTRLTATGTYLDDAIASVQQNYTNQTAATRDGISGVQTNLQERVVASDGYEVVREKLKEDISNTEDDIAQLDLFWTRVKDYFNNEDIPDDQAAQAFLHNKITQLLAELEARTLEFLKAKKEAETYADTYQNLYDESKNILLEEINRTLIAIEQIKVAYEKLSTIITTTIDNNTDRIAALQDRITKVTNNVEAEISEIRNNWSTNISELKQIIINFIRACRSRITLISIDLPDINDDKDFITIIITINEEGYPGEVLDEVEEFFCRIIRAALMAYGQTTQVDVQASVSVKRANTAYTATVGQTPPTEPQPQSNTPGTPGGTPPPSSAITLVFSFATLVAFILATLF